LQRGFPTDDVLLHLGDICNQVAKLCEIAVPNYLNMSITIIIITVLINIILYKAVTTVHCTMITVAIIALLHRWQSLVAYLYWIYWLAWSR